jgi:hypothetical protein
MPPFCVALHLLSSIHSELVCPSQVYSTVWLPLVQTLYRVRSAALHARLTIPHNLMLMMDRQSFAAGSRDPPCLRVPGFSTVVLTATAFAPADSISRPLNSGLYSTEQRHTPVRYPSSSPNPAATRHRVLSNARLSAIHDSSSTTKLLHSAYLRGRVLPCRRSAGL